MVPLGPSQPGVWLYGLAVDPSCSVTAALPMLGHTALRSIGFRLLECRDTATEIHMSSVGSGEEKALSVKLCYCTPF